MKKSLPQMFVLYKFDDGSTEQISWVDQQTQLFCSYAGMYCSGDAILRSDGRLAFRRVAQELHDTKIKLYVERLRHEKLVIAGKKGAAVRWGARDELLNLIATLAASTDRWGANVGARELWPLFFSGLDSLGLAPEEKGPPETCDDSRICWDGNSAGMQFTTFRNALIRARKEIEK